MNQESELKEIISRNPVIQMVLERAPTLGFSNWYLGAGVIAQTVWNHKHGFELNTGIKDCDLVYFDPDTSYEKEDTFIKRGMKVFKDISIPVEIRNQARVHLWYKKHFGYNISPHGSSEAAIDTWPTTATAVGITRNPSGNLLVYAPFGLDDLLHLVVRPNKKKITEEIYNNKVNRWKAVWPKLKVIPWDENAELTQL